MIAEGVQTDFECSVFSDIVVGRVIGLRESMDAFAPVGFDDCTEAAVERAE